VIRGVALYVAIRVLIVAALLGVCSLSGAR
jgi:Tfp pilus assembly protein PilX